MQISTVEGGLKDTAKHGRGALKSGSSGIRVKVEGQRKGREVREKQIGIIEKMMKRWKKSNRGIREIESCSIKCGRQI